MAAGLGGMLVGGILCLPVGAAFAALFLWAACKVLKEERPYSEVFKAALALAVIMALLNLPTRFINMPLVTTPIMLVLGAVIGAFLYANMLGMEPGKAFLVWLTQQGMLFAFCLVACGGPLLVTGGAAEIFRKLQFNQVAQAPDDGMEDESSPDEPAGDANASMSGEASADATPAEAMPGDAMPAEGEAPAESESPPENSAPPEGEPAPTSDAPGEPAPTPDGEPSTTPEPETPTEPAPAPPPELKFPAGFQGDAQRAYHDGRIHDGDQYLRAALLTSDDPALWNNVRWCEALNRPVMGLRWGIGLQMAELPPMLQAAANQAQGNGAPPENENPPDQPNEGNAENPGEGNAVPAQPDELAELRKFTGEFGPKLLAELPKTPWDALLGPIDPGVRKPRNVQFIGVAADARAVQSLAQQKGVNILLIAAVTFKVYGANRGVDANLTARLVDVDADKRLWTSKLISSNQAKAALNRGKDPTAEMIGSLREYLEHQFHLRDRPDVDAAAARQLAETAADSQNINPLPSLVEVRYYQLKGLLTPLQAEFCYQKLLDEQTAPIMASGNPDQRRKAIERFLPH